MFDEVKHVDRTLQTFMNQLAKNGLENKTNVIIVGDHGMSSGRDKVWVSLFDYAPKDKLTYLGNSGAYAGLQPAKGKLNEV